MYGTRQGLYNGTVSVRLSVCLSYRPLQQRAAGLLLWARRAGDTVIDRPAATAPQQRLVTLFEFIGAI